MGAALMDQDNELDGQEEYTEEFKGPYEENNEEGIEDLVRDK